jgi:hypothetical protein
MTWVTNMKQRVSTVIVLLAAGTAAVGIAVTAWAQSGPGKLPVHLRCPAQQVTVGVESPASFPQPWWDTPYVMQLKSLSISLNVGGKPGLSCIYAGSGKDWIVARPMAPDFKSCSISGDHFVCTPN